MRVLLAAGMLALTAPAAAQVLPPPIGDAHVQVVDYRPDQVVQLQAAAGYQMSVEFAPDEHVESVAVGDSTAWQVSANRAGDRIFLRLVDSASTTNMTVVTDVRTYLFDLSPASGSASMPYVVRFRYAAAPPVAGTAAPVITHYTAHGARALQPSAMHDDGEHTYIQWPASARLPAVYGIGANGQETLLNGMMRDGVYVVDGVVRRVIFRIDGKTAYAVREREGDR